MKDTFAIGAQRFSCRIDPRTGTLCIQSIHPYDETNYHWARQGVTGHNWFVFREGKRVATLGQLTKEQVAQELLNLDRQAHLHRRGGIW
ncbi:MAG: hypothetical protein IKD70_01950 [Eggerthellaceae bacterium]|nr:hypothetical protein [Eggerthellaceae bacterium]